ncbi:MAG TPA: hypothetical protein VFU72_01165 [Nitrolancea sp.]|nr:hypothetical protein [Nitrolancea sp.]
MMLKGRGVMDPQTLVEELLRQRDVLRAHTNLVETLSTSIQEYERRYSLSSDQLHAAIEAGQLQETEEVCDWIIDYELLKQRTVGESEGPSRLE